MTEPRESWPAVRLKVRVLGWWLWHARRKRTEQCFRCGRLVGEVWRAERDLWNAVAGEPGWEARAGEMAYLGFRGCLCRRCFVKQASERGIGVHLIYMADESYERHCDQENAESWGDDAWRYWEMHPKWAPQRDVKMDKTGGEQD
jgi:DNA-directed RNA polymerase subunit N (RpoN/RPB10)